MVIAFAFVTVTIPMHAAQLRGRLFDSTTAVLPGVTIEATPGGGGKTAVAVSGSDGTYAIDVAPGTYDVAFRLINFATTVKRGVVVENTKTLDATLYLATSAEVVVTAKQTFRNLADMNEPANDLIGIADAATVGVVTAEEIDRRPFARAGEIMETVPGVVISQHSGEGKAN
ncbi:MAG TPA: carboxypeptidase regulatory-like domain-containing protein, partial [Thermoanaerobaculia bacterium]